ncbi:hypothetical protein Halhy_3623 [Haliscomenobacter hydrossis DSM 1100]|uniref:Uncharacterized protein n=1 Tax=Haliscomenobacter hydrossis (strain ATCC 27775 / DSM 1100 / LMG 10767 / O) TaxID=760192 RepID=F4KYT3_HALH1|nr:hypothetical protein Halhy_3623 [Haliscomenobacter hydrossis DSM 1100]
MDNFDLSRNLMCSCSKMKNIYTSRPITTVDHKFLSSFDSIVCLKNGFSKQAKYFYICLLVNLALDQNPDFLICWVRKQLHFKGASFNFGVKSVVAEMSSA